MAVYRYETLPVPGHAHIYSYSLYSNLFVFCDFVDRIVQEIVSL